MSIRHFDLGRLFALLGLSLAPALAVHAQVPQSEYAQRRALVTSRLDDGVLVAFGADEPRLDYLTFVQDSRFMYLTGLGEPSAALVVVKRGGDIRATLFVQRRVPASEAWSGARLGTDGATRLTGLPARAIDSLPFLIDSLARAGLAFHLVSAPGGESGSSPNATRLRAMAGGGGALRMEDASAIVDQARGRKSSAELDLIRKAAAITVAAHSEAMRAIEPGMNEFELQALIEYTFRRNGADRPAFATIVGSGPNATTLHYNADDRFMTAGDVVVMDIGASYRGYAADVTRTVPVSGTFTAEQRAIYQIVRDAQAAAERQAKPGAAARQMNDSASAVLAAGLARLGLIESAGATYDCGTGKEPAQCPQFRLFYFHGLGHGIGLDVHDPEQFYFTRTLAPGSVFTIEPGLYVRADVLDHLPDTPRNRALSAKLRPLIERYKHIGVRIEDDYIITERGAEWISRAPRELAEVEALMRQPWTGPAPRDPTIVEWYRETMPQP
ncbi:MAG: aminopeptidase P family protein [Gemmatimonadota bacterium]|nr:aminopeptidase P family protein [Gemmatimonadota bacterium]